MPKAFLWAFSVLGVGIVALIVWTWGGSDASSRDDRVTATAGVAAAAFGAVSGFAGAAAAYSALGAARESRATGRDAAEALGLAMEPKIDVWRRSRSINNGPVEHSVTVQNIGRWPATDLKITLRGTDGATFTGTLPVIDPAESDSKPHEVDFPIKPGTRSRPVEDKNWIGIENRIEVITVEYSDQRGLLRWLLEKTSESGVARSADGIQSSETGAPETVVTRLR